MRVSGDTKGESIPPGDREGSIEQTGSHEKRQMRTAMKGDDDLVGRDGDVGRHGEQVAKDVASLCIRVATNAASEPTIQATGKDEQSQIEVDLESD